jgi:hypothetical protein
MTAHIDLIIKYMERDLYKILPQIPSLGVDSVAAQRSASDWEAPTAPQPSRPCESWSADPAMEMGLEGIEIVASEGTESSSLRPAW